MVFWVKYALTVAAMGAFLASCSENLEKVSTEELTPPADDPSAGNFLRTAPVVFTEAEVEDGIRNGSIFDSKTLSAWLCWKLSR